MKTHTTPIYLGADHGGFRLKERVKRQLVKQKWTVHDMGAYIYDAKDDYPLFGLRVAKKVAQHNNALGILFCTSGIGMNIAANKIRGIRAGLVTHPSHAAAGRRDDNMNILALAARTTSPKTAASIVHTFLTTRPSTAARHLRRVRMLNTYGTRS